MSWWLCQLLFWSTLELVLGRMLWAASQVQLLGNQTEAIQAGSGIFLFLLGCPLHPDVYDNKLTDLKKNEKNG